MTRAPNRGRDHASRVASQLSGKPRRPDATRASTVTARRPGSSSPKGSCLVVHPRRTQISRWPGQRHKVERCATHYLQRQSTNRDRAADIVRKNCHSHDRYASCFNRAECRLQCAGVADGQRRDRVTMSARAKSEHVCTAFGRRGLTNATRVSAMRGRNVERIRLPTTFQP